MPERCDRLSLAETHLMQIASHKHIAVGETVASKMRIERSVSTRMGLN
jgi:hypothetical protein